MAIPARKTASHNPGAHRSGRAYGSSWDSIYKIILTTSAVSLFSLQAISRHLGRRAAVLLAGMQVTALLKKNCARNWLKGRMAPANLKGVNTGDGRISSPSGPRILKNRGVQYVWRHSRPGPSFTTPRTARILRMAHGFAHPSERVTLDMLLFLFFDGHDAVRVECGRVSLCFRASNAHGLLQVRVISIVVNIYLVHDYAVFLLLGFALANGFHQLKKLLRQVAPAHDC